MDGAHQILWDFHCRAEKLPDGYYRVRLTTPSGRLVDRIGYHPLWELIRAIQKQETNATPTKDDED